LRENRLIGFSADNSCQRHWMVAGLDLCGMHCGFLAAAVRAALPGGALPVFSPKDIDMHLPHEAMLLRIFIGESDRWRHQPLYEAIVLKAREVHLAGATVLRGPMGYGKSSRLHTAKILRLSMDLPLVIEIVDTEEKIQAFLPVLDEMMKGGLVTLERVRVIDYRASPDLEEPEI
jgi:uncharacterized protein